MDLPSHNSASGMFVNLAIPSFGDCGHMCVVLEIE